MAQVTINNSFYQKATAFQEEIEESLREQAEDMVSYAVSISPVDTGAYVDSFSITSRGSGGGRSRSSNNKMPVNGSTARSEAISRLYSGIKSLNILDGFTIRNRAPHANDVEYGGPNWKRDGYFVFTQLRNRFK